EPRPSCSGVPKRIPCREVGCTFVAQSEQKLWSHVSSAHPRSNIYIRCDLAASGGQRCNYVCRDRKALRLHQRSTKHTITDEHVGELAPSSRPFECRICESRFTSYDRKKRHLKVQHPTDPNLWPCGLCDWVADSRDSLKKHGKRSHKDHPTKDCCSVRVKKAILAKWKDHRQREVRRGRRPSLDSDDSDDSDDE
ncbi:hypothetical protein U1Q18_049173, partial [Sarracenia purpurea var. burkii]